MTSPSGVVFVDTIDTPLILAASQLEDRRSLSFWDALIIEAARRAGATRLVSEDLQAGARIVGVLIDDPFAPRPTS